MKKIYSTLGTYTNGAPSKKKGLDTPSPSLYFEYRCGHRGRSVVYTDGRGPCGRQFFGERPSVRLPSVRHRFYARFNRTLSSDGRGRLSSSIT